MLIQTFICKSASGKHNIMYVSIIILCTDWNAIAVIEII